ncbi:MAG: 50S ribosomal protein L3 [Candidatus Comchoanobacterales bacterium]
MVALVAKKLGMTSIFDENGIRTPVTVLKLYPSQVMEYNADRSVVKLMGGEKLDAKKINKPLKGQIDKAKVEARAEIYECYAESGQEYEVSQSIDYSNLNNPKFVNVIGTTKGKGFAGTIKRHNFSSQRNTHGVSKAHRKPGSIGQCQDPGRVFKGKKMAGHMGSVQQTTFNLKVVEYNQDDQYLLVKGAVPGAKNSKVMLSASTRKGSAE